MYANTTFRDLTSNAVKAFQSSLSDPSKLDSCILIDDANSKFSTGCCVVLQQQLQNNRCSTTCLFTITTTVQ